MGLGDMDCRCTAMGLIPTTSTAAAPSLPPLPLPFLPPLPPLRLPSPPLRRASTRMPAMMSSATAPPAPPAMAAVLSPSAEGAAAPGEAAAGEGDGTGNDAVAGLAVMLPGTTPAEMDCGLGTTTPDAMTAATPRLRAIELALLDSTAATVTCSALALNRDSAADGTKGCGDAVALPADDELEDEALLADASTPSTVVWNTRSRPLPAGEGDACSQRLPPRPRRRGPEDIDEDDADANEALPPHEPPLTGLPASITRTVSVPRSRIWTSSVWIAEIEALLPTPNRMLRRMAAHRLVTSGCSDAMPADDASSEDSGMPSRPTRKPTVALGTGGGTVDGDGVAEIAPCDGDALRVGVDAAVVVAVAGLRLTDGDAATDELAVTDADAEGDGLTEAGGAIAVADPLRDAEPDGLGVAEPEPPEPPPPAAPDADADAEIDTETDIDADGEGERVSVALPPAPPPPAVAETEGEGDGDAEGDIEDEGDGVELAVPGERDAAGLTLLLELTLGLMLALGLTLGLTVGDPEIEGGSAERVTLADVLGDGVGEGGTPDVLGVAGERLADGVTDELGDGDEDMETEGETEGDPVAADVTVTDTVMLGETDAEGEGDGLGLGVIVGLVCSLRPPESCLAASTLDVNPRTVTKMTHARNPPQRRGRRASSKRSRSKRIMDTTMNEGKIWGYQLHVAQKVNQLS